MTVEETIEAALLGRVRTLALVPPLPVAWPNSAFPAQHGPKPARYLRVDHLPNRNQRLFLRGDDPHWRRGILQLTVVLALNRGPTEGTRLAGEVARHFPADLALYGDGVKLTISEAPSVAPALRNETSWDVAVSIRYEAFAP